MKKVISLFLIAVLISGCNRMTDNVNPAPQSLNASALVSQSQNAPIIVPAPIFMPAPTPAPKENVLPLPDMADVVKTCLRVAAVPVMIMVAVCGYFCFKRCFTFDIKKLATAKKTEIKPKENLRRAKVFDPNYTETNTEKILSNNAFNEEFLSKVPVFASNEIIEVRQSLLA
ncbi:MAG: hypothetical protein LBU33_00365 [Endomicrobium sp.]|jgi:hypothetical protein|nr:hypothetical protein [Endomicrobium sp.]